MSPTISATNKAYVPKKKILGERNKTLDAVEQHFGSKLMKCSVVDSDDVVERDFVGSKPFDPVKNYLSPRPKFLRYNLDRRSDCACVNDTSDMFDEYPIPFA
ncbi:hypothetical protein HanIR_Chr02g0096461 [Helianthus annuus]|nr:hypothetical protein HanIR_Chr02g0096461 [Helianthus annuus]